MSSMLVPQDSLNHIMPYYQYRDTYDKDKTGSLLFYLYSQNSHTWKDRHPAGPSPFTQRVWYLLYNLTSHRICELHFLYSTHQERCAQSRYQGQGQVITPHNICACNYLYLPLISVSDTTLLTWLGPLLTHWGLMTPYGDIDLGQHWPR